MAREYLKVVEMNANDFASTITYQRNMYEQVFSKKDTNEDRIVSLINAAGLTASIASLLMPPGIKATAVGIASLITAISIAESNRIGRLIDYGQLGLSEDWAYLQSISKTFDKLRLEVAILEYPEKNNIRFITSRTNNILAAKYKGSNNWTSNI